MDIMANDYYSTHAHILNTISWTCWEEQHNTKTKIETDPEWYAHCPARHRRGPCTSWGHESAGWAALAERCGDPMGLVRKRRAVACSNRADNLSRMTSFDGREFIFQPTLLIQLYKTHSFKKTYRRSGEVTDILHDKAKICRTLKIQPDYWDTCVEKKRKIV